MKRKLTFGVRVGQPSVPESGSEGGAILRGERLQLLGEGQKIVSDLRGKSRWLQ